MPPYNLEMKVYEQKGEIMALKKVEGELQIDENTQRLYWNGKQIVTRSEFLVGSFVVTAAGVTAFASVVRLLVVDLKWLKFLQMD